ncbi:hypothetical protein [Spirosoma knui]
MKINVLRMSRYVPMSCFALLSLVDVSCKKQEVEVTPQPDAAYLIWTAKPDDQFDQITVKVDGKTVGTINRPFIVTPNKPKPDCDDRGGGIVYVELTAGDHQMEATGQLNGKPAGHWQGNLHAEANYCKLMKLNHQ